MINEYRSRLPLRPPIRERIGYFREATIYRCLKYRSRGEWKAVRAELYFGLRLVVTGKYSWE